MQSEPIQLGCYDLHDRQLEFLRLFQRQQEDVAITHYVGGRRSGKSVIAAFSLFYSATTFNRGLPHLWTSPTNQDCKDTFLRTWEMIVPSHLYTQNKNEQRLYIHNTGGSVIDYRTREVTNTRKEGFRGPTYAGAVVDEARQDPDETAWSNIQITVSEPRAKQLWMISSSTPKMNWYHDRVVDGNDPIVYGTSYDNPYVSEAVINQIKADNSPEQARQEIFAEWISMADRVWPNADIDNLWPNGNIHPHTYDPDLPFYLSCDIGLKSAWLIIQHVDGVAVVVGEYTPAREDSDTTISKIESDYGSPARVIVGSDWNTGNVMVGKSHATHFRSRGWACQVTPIKPGTMQALKDYQHKAANRLILDSLGRRRFCISQGLISHNPRNKCGIRELFLRDEWPEKIRTGAYLNKDKNEKGKHALEDVRDAFMYYAAVVHPIQSIPQAAAA